MQILERTKGEVANKANTMSDFLKMEYLELCTQRVNNLEILKYCYSELINLYESRVMYSDALKYLSKLRSLTTIPREAFPLYKKEIELFLKAGYYDKVLGSYNEAVKLTNEINSLELRREVIRLYRLEADKLESTHKYAVLVKLYEKLLIWLNDFEKNEIMKKLSIAYQKTGKIRESIGLDRRIYKEI